MNVLNSLKEVTILQRKNEFKSQFSDTVRTITKFQKKNNLLRFVPKIIYEVTAMLMISIACGYFVIQNIDINESLEILEFFSIAIVKIVPAFNKIILSYQNLNVSYFPALKVLEEIDKIKNETTLITEHNERNSKKLFDKKLEVKIYLFHIFIKRLHFR